MIFSSIKNWVIGLAVGFLVGGCTILYFKNASLEAQVSKLTSDLTAEMQLNLELGTELQDAKAQSDMHYQLYYDQVEVNQELYDQVVAKNKEINKYKGREGTVYAKPGLVERLEQKALKTFFEGVQEVD